MFCGCPDSQLCLISWHSSLETEKSFRVLWFRVCSGLGFRSEAVRLLTVGFCSIARIFGDGRLVEHCTGVGN